MVTVLFALWLQGSNVTIRAASTDVAVRCMGTRAARQPLVVLEAGGGDDLGVWSLVQAPISDFARVCAYSRPTLIRNGVDPRAGSSPTQVIQTLRDVLTQLGEAPPYVMVGHSYGGMIVRLYAQTYPDDVTGMVLIDSSHEDMIARFEAADPSLAAQLRAPGRSEATDLVAISAALNEHRWRADIPLVVLTRGKLSNPDDPNERIWLDLQNELATRSAQSTHTVVTSSGHYIHREQPALVSDAVKRVVGGQPF
jgi:pimeloyl-ACP methyl ester carboxylesterase